VGQPCFQNGAANSDNLYPSDTPLPQLGISVVAYIRKRNTMDEFNVLSSLPHILGDILRLKQ
jgi:hypothetical protein